MMTCGACGTCEVCPLFLVSDVTVIACASFGFGLLVGCVGVRRYVWGMWGDSALPKRQIPCCVPTHWLTPHSERSAYEFYVVYAAILFSITGVILLIDKCGPMNGHVSERVDGHQRLWCSFPAVEREEKDLREPRCGG